MNLRCHEVKADNTNIVVIAACVIRYQYKINFIMKGNITMKFSVDSSINRDCKLMNKRGPSLYPFLVSSPKEELLACRETAWLGCFLNISPVYDVSGPDAVKLLNDVCVNRDFSKLKISGSRHALMCNEKGQLIADGLITRIDDETFRTYWLAPALPFYVDTLGMNVKGQWITDEYFFQIDGPKSLQILEKATQTDLHDIKFAGKKDVKIAGTDMTVVRLGMSGCLAYEVHGEEKNADLVFDTIMEAGKEFGIKQQGTNTYCRNHTQGGYPNQWIHFWYPWLSSGDALAQFVTNEPHIAPHHKIYPFSGSASDDVQNAFVTPHDLAWDYLISYDHDFVGKEALQEIEKKSPRKCVTLEWNAADVGVIFASQFMGAEVEPLDIITKVGDGADEPFIISKVLCEGSVVGVASGRTHDFYHRRMISLAFIKSEFAIEGKELKILWGTPGTPQKEIRAIVAQFPYYNEEYRNETFDVEKIPHPVFNV